MAERERSSRRTEPERERERPDRVSAAASEPGRRRRDQSADGERYRSTRRERGGEAGRHPSYKSDDSAGSRNDDFVDKVGSLGLDG